VELLLGRPWRPVARGHHDGDVLEVPLVSHGGALRILPMVNHDKEARAWHIGSSVDLHPYSPSLVKGRCRWYRRTVAPCTPCRHPAALPASLCRWVYVKARRALL
jgi:hypothetical protein